MFLKLYDTPFFDVLPMCHDESVPCHRRARALEGEYVGDNEVSTVLYSRWGFFVQIALYY